MPDHDASRAQERTPISLRSKVMGVVALLASGFCVLEGFGVANATYIDSGMYPRARAIGLGLGLAAFLFLWLAWRCLGRKRRADIILIAVADIAHLACLAAEMIRMA